MEVVGTTMCALHSLLRLNRNEVSDIFRSTSDFERFRKKVSSIEHIFMTALRKDNLSAEELQQIKNLKDAIFEADNLVNEYVTYSKQKSDGIFGSMSVTSLMSKRVKNVREKLDAITNNKFDLVPDPQPVWYRKPQTCSDIDEADIIGRRQDLEKIIGMLLDPNNVQQGISFLSIVGIGGIGKTTLAQLLFNDPRVSSLFPLRFWACVSDQGQERLNIKQILDKILASMKHEGRRLFEKQKLQQLLYSKQYLLVLDDVWTENRVEWLRLSSNFAGDQRGSWIVVTTRSQGTARNVGGHVGLIYNLRGLSDADSWRLFKRVAFVPEETGSPLDNDLIQLGREIVDGCAGVPLAIKEVGSLLYGQEKSKWQSLKNSGLTSAWKSDDGIMSTLQLSYRNLTYPLRNCFIYCALFPKDFRMEKEMLISLWMAQDYIEPLPGDQSVKHLGEEYFFILEKRGFFQDITRDEFGEIVSFKLHHLKYDLARSVDGGEMCIMKDSEAHVDSRNRHVSFVDGPWIGDNFLDSNLNIRSLLHIGYTKVQGDKVPNLRLDLVLERCRFLKALDLSGLSYKTLPDSIGLLSLLRFLNLSGNTKIEELPDAITKLLDLQTLLLRECRNLKALPKKFCRLTKLWLLDMRSCSRLTCIPEDISKLTDLRILNIRNCSSLMCLPKDICKLISLQKLSDFILGDQERNTSWKQLFHSLWSLRPVGKLLQGRLNIGVWWPTAKMVAEDDTWNITLYPLKNKVRLLAVEFDFKPQKLDRRFFEEFERPPPPIEELTRLMKEMEPPPSVKHIKVRGYLGARMDWLTFSLNLVELVLERCWELQFLPCLGNLPHLKVFKLLSLKKLKYIGQDSPLANSSSISMPAFGSVGSSSYYPSLEALQLENLPLFKGWRSLEGYDGGSSNNSDNKAHWQLLPRFVQLNSLFMWNCPELTCIPHCPAVEELKLINFNRKLRVTKFTERGENLVDVASSSSSSIAIDYPETSSSNGTFIQKCFKKVVLSDVVWLNSFPMIAFKRLEHLELWCDKEVESLLAVSEVFRSCSSSLRILIIHNCSKLRSVLSGGIKHLAALEKLEFRNNDSLELSHEEEESRGAEGEGSVGIGHVSWSSNLHSLRTLTLQDLPKMIELPNWIQFLPALERLGISYCWGLKSLPDWMTKLTSLKLLAISSCSAILEKRCKSDPPGEDWPKIEHITTNNIRFHNNVF